MKTRTILFWTMLLSFVLQPIGILLFSILIPIIALRPEWVGVVR